MPWVRFTAPFDFSPAARGGRVTIAYPAGLVINVTRECADLARAAGKAIPAPSLRRKPDHGQERRG